MKIIYLTTSSTNIDYETILKNCLERPNPSNQNFHNALIHAFACHFNVEVFSTSLINSNKLLDNSLKHTTSFENHICYNYLSIHENKLKNYLNIKKELTKKLKIQLSNTNKNQILLVIDAMNYTLSRIGQIFAKKYKLKTLGIITDNPNLISNLSSNGKKLLLKSFANFNYYICLNENLNLLANKHNKPHIIINGVYNKTTNSKIKQFPGYFFFGGSLYEKYGIKNLIHGFLNTVGESKLLIAGDGPLKNYVVNKSIKNRRIVYLGTISQTTLQSYENHAIANINPRPFTKDLDTYCIPSKVIEYAASNALTISTHHSLLHKVFGSSIIWIEDDEKSLTEAIENIVNMSQEERKLKIFDANSIAYKNFSVDSVAIIIKDFLDQIALLC